MDNILIVVDVQNDFVTGSLGTKEAEAMIPRLVKKIQEFKGKVIATLDCHDEYYLDTQEGKNLPVKHCIVATDGWLMHKDVKEAIASNEDIICEYTIKSGFGMLPSEAKYLIGGKKKLLYDSIEVTGLCTDICVITNALLLKTLYPEILIRVDASCCAGTTVENHLAALQVMKSCQIDVSDEHSEGLFC